MVFDWSDFSLLLEPPILLMTLVLGAAVGLGVSSTSRVKDPGHLYWMLVGGIVFFVPLSLIRAFQGSTTWERWLSSLALWVVYIIGIWLGEQAHRRWWT